MDESDPDRDSPLVSTTSVQYAHSLGEIVTAAVDAGLRVVSLTEHLDSPIDLHGQPADRDGRYRLRVGTQTLPMLYTLIAQRPPAPPPPAPTIED